MAFSITSITSSDVFWALATGLLPALLWLWFWLKEDTHPEPRRVLILTFLAGMMMAIVALFLEQFASIALGGFVGSFILLFIWAGIEETTKYWAARKAAFMRPSFDEPVDAMIYLITAALGFAALENVLFLLRIFNDQGLFLGLITGNLRFLGATLLHVVASGVVGASIAFSFFHGRIRTRNVLGGLFLATVLHVFFNFFIIKGGDAHLFKIFLFLWVGVIILLFVFEKIKNLKFPPKGGSASG
jgi:RsiW-degrading membrane proteinase PrsW (M82 family)